MSSTSSVRIDDLGDEEVRRLAERLSRMNISMPGNGTSSGSQPRHSVSCISFLRSFLASPRRHTARTSNAAQSDFGVDYVVRDRSHQTVGSVANQQLVPVSPLSHDQAVAADGIREQEGIHQPSPPRTSLPDVPGEEGLGSLFEADSLLNGWSEKELQKMYDDAMKRSDKAPLPPGGVYCGRKDQRSVLTFIQECERTPAWDIGYGPSPAFFQGAYLERCLGNEVREIVVNTVDKQMKDDGYRGFLSVDSRRLLIDRWERIVWDTKKETFESFYLREDISDRLFASFADDICEDILHKFGNSPTLEELIERHGRSTVNAIESQVCDGDDDDAVATMPVAATTTDATTNTDRLFLTNLSYTATESDLLSAFRSILKVAGVAVSLLAEIVDSMPMVEGTDQPATPPVTAEAQQRPEVPANVVSSVENCVNLPADDVDESSAVNCVEGESTREVILGHSDDSSACPSIDLRNLERADGAASSKRLTSICTEIVAGDGTTTPMKWLLDSGCVAHLISSTVGNALGNARSVQLDSPVTLIYANGEKERVREARRVTLNCGEGSYTTDVLVVRGLTVPAILSLHKLARDVGFVSWFLNSEGSETLQLGYKNVLRLSSENARSAQPAFIVGSVGVCDLPDSPFDDLMCTACRPGLPRLRPPDKEEGQILVDHVPASEGLGRAAAVARDQATCRKLKDMGGTWYNDFCKEETLVLTYGSVAHAFQYYMDDLLYTSWKWSELFVRRQHGREMLKKRASMHCQPKCWGEDEETTMMAETSPSKLTEAKLCTQLGYVWERSDDVLSTRPVALNNEDLRINIEEGARQRLLLSKVAHVTASWDSKDVPCDVTQEIHALFRSSPSPQPRFVDLRQGFAVFCDAAGNGCICADVRGMKDGRRLVARQATLNSKWTIPRLELCSILLGYSLMEEVLGQREAITSEGLSIGPIWLLTDSQLNAWRIKRPSRADARYLPLLERNRMTKLRSGLTALAKETGYPIKMVPMDGLKMQAVLQEATVVTTFSPTPSFSDEDFVDEFDEQKDEKGVPDAVSSADLLFEIGVAQEACNDLALLKKKLGSQSVDGYMLKNGVLHRAVVPDNRRDLQWRIIRHVHDVHGGHPGQAPGRCEDEADVLSTSSLLCSVSRSSSDSSQQKLYCFTLCCHASRFIKATMVTEEGPIRLLVVDQGLLVPEVLSLGKELGFLVVSTPPRGEELRAWGALWDISNKTKSLPSEEEFVQLLYRAVWICNNTPYIDESPLTPALVCRSHGRMVDDPSALSEAETIKKAVFEGLEPPSWWDEVTANDYFDKVTEGRLVALRELADIWWLRRRETRERLLSRTKRHAGRGLVNGSRAFRWRPTLGPYGKLNTGWEEVEIVDRPSDSIRKVRLISTGKIVNESVLNLRSAPAGSVPVSA
ncbi:hypothetical protein FOZ60_003859 [Perkinsus olseni]|uniref:Uncharacterized protein n=1 Tax=Perkinsus olseni TaxID=32597 RepID=A0A7J6NUE8_PEROL|nr:hypothetical protein FOZ60_003859 [Perkinsus olseni]